MKLSPEQLSAEAANLLEQATRYAAESRLDEATESAVAAIRMLRQSVGGTNAPDEGLPAPAPDPSAELMLARELAPAALRAVSEFFAIAPAGQWGRLATEPAEFLGDQAARAALATARRLLEDA